MMDKIPVFFSLKPVEANNEVNSLQTLYFLYLYYNKANTYIYIYKVLIQAGKNYSEVKIHLIFPTTLQWRVTATNANISSQSKTDKEWDDST